MSLLNIKVCSTKLLKKIPGGRKTVWTNFNPVKNICVSANKFVLLRRNKAHARLKHF